MLSSEHFPAAGGLDFSCLGEFGYSFGKQDDVGGELGAMAAACGLWRLLMKNKAMFSSSHGGEG